MQRIAEQVVVEDAGVEPIVGLGEIERVHADQPLATAARDGAGLREQADFLVVSAAIALVPGDVVIDHRRPKFVVAPVRIEAECRVGLRCTGDAHEIERRQLRENANRACDRTLCILAGFIGVRREAVVDGPRVVAIIDVDVQPREIDIDPIARLPRQLAARGQLVAAVRVVSIEVGVVTKAVALILMQRCAITQRVVDRAAERRAEGQRSVVTGRRLDVRGKRLRRLHRSHVDQSAERIGAVACALWSAQHFDTLDVEQRGDASEAREVDVVDDEAHGRIRRAFVLLELADAAQLKVASSGTLTRPVQVRHLLHELFEVLHAAHVEIVLVEHADAHRQIRDALLPEVCRDDDLFELSLGARCGGPCCGRGGGRDR